MVNTKVSAYCGYLIQLWQSRDNHLLIILLEITHQPKDGHEQRPEERRERGQDAIGQTGHHKSRTSDRRVQPLNGKGGGGERSNHIDWHQDSSDKLMHAWANLVVIMCVERQAEQVRSVFGGAVRLRSPLVLHVLDSKSWSVSVAGGGPDDLGAPAVAAQDGFQLPNLGYNTIRPQIFTS